MYVIFVKPATCCHIPPQRQVCSGTAAAVCGYKGHCMHEYLPQYLAACLFLFVSLFLVFQRSQASFNVLGS